jgi:limonene-1,2-epoxide hydrolase
MTNAETAKAFTDLLKAGDHHGAAKQFNAASIVSIEAMEGPMARVEGAAAVQAKSDWWYGAHEVHKSAASGPYVNGNQFVVRFDVDVTVKATGQRMQMQEIGLYTVKDGMIVEEKFLY